MIVTYVTVKISDSITETIDNSRLDTLSSKLATAYNVNTPSFGLTAGSGSVVFKDEDKKFVTYSQDKLLNSSNEIKIYLKDTVSGKEQLCGSWLSKDWNYDEDNFNVSVSLRDNLEDMQNIDVNDTAQYVGLVTRNDVDGLVLYNFIKDEAPSNFEFDELDSNVSTLLESIKIKYAYLQSGKLWQHFNDLCELALLYMHKDFDGKIKVEIIR